jgi:hypothetical protein
MPVYVTKNTNPQIRAAIETAAKKAVAKAALDTEAEAKLNATANGSVKTGAMRASIYSVTPYRSHYARAVAEAKSRLAKRGGAKKVEDTIFFFPESIPVQSAGVARSIVSCPISYGFDVENGTKAHIIKPKNKKALFWPKAKHPVRLVRHPGSMQKPFMKPAEDKIRPRLLSASLQILKGQIGAAG